KFFPNSGKKAAVKFSPPISIIDINNKRERDENTGKMKDSSYAMVTIMPISYKGVELCTLEDFRRLVLEIIYVQHLLEYQIFESDPVASYKHLMDTSVAPKDRQLKKFCKETRKKFRSRFLEKFRITMFDDEDGVWDTAPLDAEDAMDIYNDPESIDFTKIKITFSVSLTYLDYVHVYNPDIDEDVPERRLKKDYSLYTMYGEITTSTTLCQSGGTSSMDDIKLGWSPACDSIILSIIEPKKLARVSRMRNRREIASINRDVKKNSKSSRFDDESESDSETSDKGKGKKSRKGIKMKLEDLSSSSSDSDDKT